MKHELTEEIKDVIVTSMIGYYLQDNKEPEAQATIVKRMLIQISKSYCGEDTKPYIDSLITDPHMMIKIEKFLDLI